jgi:peroxin-2
VLKAPSKAQKLLYGLLTVFGSYGWARWESHVSSVDSSYNEPTPLMRRLSTLTTKLSTLYSSAALASFLVFLVNGRYRTLLDRILRLRLAPPTSQVSREVSFEYLNRQLVWHAFTEFLLFLLPLVGISRWRRWLSRAWRKTKSMLTSDPNVELTGEKMGELAFLPERTCAICYQESNSAKSEAEIIAASASAVGSGDTDVTNPYECIPCGDVYCFVCIASKLESEGGEGWVCLRCGEVVKECKPWSGDVIEEQPKRESSKSVGFQDDVKAEEEEEAASEEEDYDEDGEHDERGEYEDDDEGSESEAYEEDEDMEDGPDFDE